VPGFLEALVGFVVFVFSVVVHETSHGLAAERFGDYTARMAGRITLNPLPHIDPVGSVLVPVLAYISHIPFIGWAKPVPVVSANLRNPRVHSAYVAAAGPASNLLLIVLGTLGWAVVRLAYKHLDFLALHGGNSLLFFNLLFGSLVVINSVLAFFNLIPVPPLDGHWILMRFLPPSAAQALESLRPYGFLILLVLLWTGVIGAIVAVPIQYVYGNAVNLVRLIVSSF